MKVLLLLLIVLVFIIVSTAKFKLHPFISLMVSAIFVGLASGLDTQTVITSIGMGFGNTLKGIGIIIAFGTIIGSFLEKSGGTATLANTVLKWTGKKRSPLAMNLTGLIVSIPVFCDSGFIILSSINKALSRFSGISLTIFAVALSTGLYVSHVFVPPTPGPLAAAEALDANIGVVMLLGLLLALPTALVGLLWAKFIGKRIVVSQKKITKEEKTEPLILDPWSALAPIMVPVVLIALRSVAEYPTLPLGEGNMQQTVLFFGHPMIALFIGMIFSFILGSAYNKNQKFTWTTNALKDAGLIVLITGAGGAFGNVLRDTGIGETIGSGFSNFKLGIFLPFIIAAVIKSAQGSSTVSIITTAAVVAPIMSSLGMETEISKALGVLAIGAGAMTVSHVNDSYFWVVSQFSGLDVRSALKSHTMATFLQGTFAIGLLTLLNELIAK